jgi:hypothetical protein
MLSKAGSKLKRGFIIYVSVLLLSPCYIDAAVPVKLGEPVIESVSEIGVYYFSKRDYIPPISIDPSQISEWKTVNSPESVAYLQISSMLLGDYQGWLATWDEKSRAIIENRNTEKGRDASFWVARWKKGLGVYTKFHLTRRVDMTESVIIEFRASSHDNTLEKMFLDIPVIKGKNGMWYVTQSLAKNIVLNQWRRPGYKTESVMSQPPKL